MVPNSLDTPSTQASQLEIAGGDTDEGLRVTTFNTWLIPVAASACFLDYKISKRAVKVANYLNRGDIDSDILLLQEVWEPQGSTGILALSNAMCCNNLRGRGILERIALHRYFNTQRTRIPFFSKASWMTFLDSGLVIASKWPIEKEHYVRYTAKAGEDALASKGVLLAYTNNMLVVNTHLNANPQHGGVRTKQLLQLKDAYLDFRNQLQFEGRQVDKVIVGGDWNIDGACNCEESIEEYSNLVNVMGSMGLTDAIGKPRTWDRNGPLSTATYRDVCGSSMGENVAPRRLDMVFTNANVTSIHAMWKDSDPPALYHPDDPDMVSDHAPIVARLRFP